MVDEYGLGKGFSFLTNSFDQYLNGFDSLNFQLSISAAHEPNDIARKNYVIEPGYQHTFRVLAKQTVSSEVLKSMSRTDRNCLLLTESEGLNFSNFYTKSGCENECLVNKAIEKFGCAPWYIPFFEDVPYCNVYDNSFQNYINHADIPECICPTECEETEYSIIKSNQLLQLPKRFCTNDLLKVKYPFNVYCQICQKIISIHRIRLIYDHYVNNGPNPDDVDRFCRNFVAKYVALVNVEMVSKSIVRSLRDKRFSLMSQVSNLGKNQEYYKKTRETLSNFRMSYLVF
jgi:hypothetical protein